MGAEALRVAAVAIALACCAPRPSVVEPTASPTPWCFRLRFAFNGRAQAAIGCAETEALCLNAQRRAVAFGALMGATEVGRCHVAR